LKMLRTIATEFVLYKYNLFPTKVLLMWYSTLATSMNVALLKISG
jgi:hypothetical protein